MASCPMPRWHERNSQAPAAMGFLFFSYSSLDSLFRSSPSSPHQSTLGPEQVCEVIHHLSSYTESLAITIGQSVPEERDRELNKASSPTDTHHYETSSQLSNCQQPPRENTFISSPRPAGTHKGPPTPNTRPHLTDGSPCSRFNPLITY